MKNSFIAEALRIKYYIMILVALFFALGLLAFSGTKLSGSTSSEKFAPGGSGAHHGSSFYHK